MNWMIHIKIQCLIETWRFLLMRQDHSNPSRTPGLIPYFCFCFCCLNFCLYCVNIMTCCFLYLDCPFIWVAFPYLLTLPLFTGVSRVRALSPAWTGSHARETLFSRIHLFLPHDILPTKKSSTINKKSWPTFCDQYFWKSPIWNSCTDEKRREIRMVKVFKWYPVIYLFDTFTGKLGHGD